MKLPVGHFGEFILQWRGRFPVCYIWPGRSVRAERLCVRLGREDPLDPSLLRFLNRLSDALFVLARWMAKQQKQPEFLWQRDSNG